jgi:hypothetical protein
MSKKDPQIDLALAAQALARMGGFARAKSLTPAQRSRSASHAAKARFARMSKAELHNHGLKLARARARKRANN